MQKKYDAVDLLKLIGSILVFTMHLGLFRGTVINSAIQLSARWCVPFFFIISSFFLFRKSNNGTISAGKLSGYVKRIMLLYAAWTLVNLPQIIYEMFLARDLLSPDTYFRFFKCLLLSSSFTGSWYLTGSVVGAVIVYLLSKKMRNGLILLCTFPIFFISVITSAYGHILPEAFSFVFKKVLCFPLNIFGGCFYIAVGKFLADHYHRIRKVRGVMVILLTFFSFAAYCTEIILAKRFNLLASADYAFTSALLGFAVAWLGITRDIRIRNSRLLRKVSTIVYCAQGNVLLFSSGLKNKLYFSNDLLRYVLILLVMAGIVVLVLLLQKKTKWRLVQYLT